MRSALIWASRPFLWQGALVRLSLESANRALIIKKLVSMLYDKGQGGQGAQEQAAAALANLASDSAENRVSIVDAGGIAPLLSLLEGAHADDMLIAC